MPPTDHPLPERRSRGQLHAVQLHFVPVDDHIVRFQGDFVEVLLDCMAKFQHVGAGLAPNVCREYDKV